MTDESTKLFFLFQTEIKGIYKCLFSLYQLRTIITFNVIMFYYQTVIEQGISKVFFLIIRVFYKILSKINTN